MILQIDGQDVEDAEGVGFRLGVKPLGGIASVSVVRGGQHIVATLPLSAAPETPARDVRRIKSRSPFQGAEVSNLSPAVLEEMSMETTTEDAPKGVIVSDVAADSLAAEYGVQKGDVIVEVNGTEIHTTRDLEQACADRPRYWDLTISRAGQMIRTRISG